MQFFRRQNLERAALTALVMGISLFYLWTALPEPNGPLFARSQPDYYNSLSRGLLSGHLYLDTPADPFLATLKDPWDPAQRAGHGLHDASYFKGHFYIYFGVTPVVALFLPVKIATGLEIHQSLASVIFCMLGFAASAWLLTAVRRRHFPGVPFSVLVIAVAATGLANTVPLLLRRASIWEVPIAAAYAFLMLGLCCLFKALLSKGSLLWLALGSLAFGLAVGARPTTLFACAALLVPVAALIAPVGGLWHAISKSRSRRIVLAATIPLAAVGLALAVYNFERFGTPFEFGQRYQLSGDDNTKLTYFSWRFPIFGLRMYWFSRATWSPYFPFVSVAAVPPRPAGQLGTEDPYGILPNMPYVFLALGTLPLLIRRTAREPEDLVALNLCIAIAASTTAAFVLFFGGVTNRYMVDFAPGCVLLASIGLFTLVSGTTPGTFRRLLCLVGALVLLAVSCAFNMLASFRHNELLRNEHPELYLRMVRSWNRIPYFFDRIFHGGYGPLELTVEFPNGKPGSNEPFVSTGHAYQSDFLLVHYEPGNQVSFGLDHTNRAPLLGRSLTLAPGTFHKVQVRMGSLYPPIGHPYFDSLDPIEAWVRQSRIEVSVDGVTALDGYASFYDAASWDPNVGHTEPESPFPGHFSGRILEWHRNVEATSPPPLSGEVSAATFILSLPPFEGPRSEPLICSGRTGRGDLLFIRYLTPTSIAVGFDHWGIGGVLSPPVRITPGTLQHISVATGLLTRQTDSGAEPQGGTPGHLIVRVNGATVIDSEQPYYRASPEQLSFGRNSIGSSSAGADFQGTIREIRFDRR